MRGAGGGVGDEAEGRTIRHLAAEAHTFDKALAGGVDISRSAPPPLFDL